MVDVFMREMSKYSIISESETISLIRNGRNRDFEKVIKGNWRLVVSAVKKTIGFISLEHVNTGMIALDYAAKNYNCDSGYKFSTYAFKVIKSQVKRTYNREKTTITLPYTATERENSEKKNRYQDEFKNAKATFYIDSIGYKNTLDDAEEKKNNFYRLLHDSYSTSGLSEQESEMNSKLTVAEIERFVEYNLSEIEKLVYKYRIIENKKIKEVANLINKTYQRVNQCEKIIQNKIKEHFKRVAI